MEIKIIANLIYNQIKKLNYFKQFKFINIKYNDILKCINENTQTTIYNLCKRYRFLLNYVDNNNNLLCKNCTNCKNCIACTNCKNCNGCICSYKCRDSYDCYYCYKINNCSKSYNCKNSNKCYQCNKCCQCNNCDICDDCNKCNVCFKQKINFKRRMFCVNSVGDNRFNLHLSTTPSILHKNLFRVFHVCHKH